MSSNTTRKEAIRNYKERKTRQGVYAIRCTAETCVWVGSSRNVDAAQNSCWFRLQHASHTDKLLQETWNRHGEEKFAFDIVDVIDDDVSPIIVDDLLKEKKRDWVAKLNARPL